MSRNLNEGEEIVVKIKGGNITVETMGIKGASCQDVDKALREMLGTQTAETIKGEFYEPEVQHVELLKF